MPSKGGGGGQVDWHCQPCVSSEICLSKSHLFQRRKKKMSKRLFVILAVMVLAFAFLSACAPKA